MSAVEDIVKAANGVAFGVPGGGPSLELIDAIERGGGRFHTAHFEGAAALMAGAVGKLSGTPGVSISIKGPGLANMASGLVTAMLEDFPVLAVAEAFGRSEGPQKAHKRIDQDRLTGAFVKARCGISEKNAVAKLTKLALAERPGPVLLELADTEPRFLPLAAKPPRNAASVLRMVEAAKRPVVIAGSMATRLGLSGCLSSLTVPVFSTAGAKGVIDEQRPNAAGVYTGAGIELAPERSLLAAADLVIGIGLRTHEVLVAGLPVAGVNVDDFDLAPGFAFSAVAPASQASCLLETLAARSAWGADQVAAVRERMCKALLAGPFLPAQVFALLADRLPDARMVLDTGFFCTIGEHMWDVRSPELYLSSGQARSMGAALPMAVGASLVRPDVPTVLAIGDGGLPMFVSELTLAASEKAPVLVLFMCDGTYASIRDRAVVKNLTQRPLMPKASDWTAVASAFGFTVGYAMDAADCADFIQKWDRKGPALLEIRFEPEPYRTMTAKLRS